MNKPARANEIDSQRATPLRFSVVVPVFEQWHLVPGLLECLEQQTFPKDRFEIILVDNDSTVFVQPAELPENARIHRCGWPGSYATRNYGAAQARGEWLAFTDADCLPSPEWLAELDRIASAAHGQLLLAGPVAMKASSEQPSPWEIYDVMKGVPQESYVSRGYAATANLAVPRSLFISLGGFDGSRFSGGDAEFCRRAGKVGVRLQLAKGARVDHRSRNTWQKLETKARRIKGGQLSAGSLRNRVVWSLRTLIPPVLGVWKFLGSRQHSARDRLTAILILFRVWIAQLAESGRLLMGHPAERR